MLTHITNMTYQRALIERTEIAAKSGAKIISWNEAAIFIQKEDEIIWQEQLDVRWRRSLIVFHSLPAYVVPISTDPLKLENKFISINSKGEIAYQYLKHQPVPGEPSIKGEEPFQVMKDHGLIIGGAICYDFDYPYIAKAFGQLNANIVAVPSSDWRGIDPLHTRMAAFRAIEQGYSILRSTRFGLSAAINQLGELTAQQSSFDSHNKIMLAELPIKKLTTVYSRIGDSFLYACFVLLVLLFISIYKRYSE